MKNGRRVNLVQSPSLPPGQSHDGREGSSSQPNLRFVLLPFLVFEQKAPWSP